MNGEESLSTEFETEWDSRQNSRPRHMTRVIFLAKGLIPLVVQLTGYNDSYVCSRRVVHGRRYALGSS